MRNRTFSFSVLVVVLLAGAGVNRARADVAPPDTCTSPGQPCQNAGPSYNLPGTCEVATCTKQVRGADGGLTPMTYTCHVCNAHGGASGAAGNAGAAGTAGNGGAGGAPATGGTTGTGGATATGGAAGKAGGGSSSGCAVAGAPTHPAAALSFTLLTILVARRRRRA